MQGKVVWQLELEHIEGVEHYVVTARRLGRRRYVVTAYRIFLGLPMTSRTAHLEFFRTLKEVEIVEATIRINAAVNR
jgi:hypothetical protein